MSFKTLNLVTFAQNGQIALEKKDGLVIKKVERAHLGDSNSDNHDRVFFIVKIDIGGISCKKIYK